MNTTDDLTRSLREQADRIGGHPIDLESVRGRARSIQRRRRAGGAVVAAAVLAVAVPVGITVAGGFNNASPPQPAPPPEPTIKPAPVQEDGSFLVDLEKAPEGSVPQVPYIAIDAHRLSTPDRSYELPDGIVQLAAYDGAWIAIQAGDYPPFGTRVVELDSNFDISSEPITSGMNLIANADGSRVAWVEVEDGRSILVNAPTDGGTPTRTPLESESHSPATAVGFLADGSVVFTTTQETTFKMEFGVATTGGDITPFSGFNTVNSTSEATGLVAGQTKFLGDGSCSAVTDPVAGSKPLWETCDYSLGAFSPDGHYIVGLAPYSDGPGSTTLSILDASTGQPVVDYSGPRGRTVSGAGQVVWEDDDTLLATVTQNADQTIVRLELDGAVSRVAPTLRTQELNNMYRFPNYPFG